MYSYSDVMMSVFGITGVIIAATWLAVRLTQGSK